MVLVCAICSESIEKSPAFATESASGSSAPEPPPRGKSNISAAPCGHVFHTFCITKWTLSGAATSHQCPNCRKNLTKKFVALFPDSYDDKPGSPDSPSTPDPAINEREISQLKSKLHTVEADFKIQVNMYQMLMQDRQALQTQFNQEQRERLTATNECDKYKQLAANREGECRLLEYQVAKFKNDLETETRKTEAERREKEKLHSMTQVFLQRKQEEIKTQYMEFAAFNLDFNKDMPDCLTRRLDLLPGTSRESAKFCPSRARPPRRGKKMVYEKSIDEILDLEDEEAVLIEPDSRKRSKLLSQRSSESNGGTKTKTKRFSSDLSMSPITLSSDTDEDPEIQAVLMDTAA